MPNTEYKIYISSQGQFTCGKLSWLARKHFDRLTSDTFYYFGIIVNSQLQMTVRLTANYEHSTAATSTKIRPCAYSIQYQSLAYALIQTKSAGAETQPSPKPHMVPVVPIQ